MLVSGVVIEIKIVLLEQLLDHFMCHSVRDVRLEPLCRLTELSVCHFVGSWIIFIDALLVNVDEEQNTGFCIPVGALTMHDGLSYCGHSGFGPRAQTAKQNSRLREELNQITSQTK